MRTTQSNRTKRDRRANAPANPPANSGRRARRWVAGCILLSLCGCLRPQQAFVAATDPRGWSLAEPADIAVENEDTVSLRTMEVVVRYDAEFAFDRLDLSVTTIAPDGYRWCDTVSVPVPDPRSHIRVNRDINGTFRSGVLLAQKGVYRFRLAPLASQDGVQGILAVGVDIH